MRFNNFIAAAAVVAALAVPAASADHASLSEIFMQFPPAERRAMQEELARAGFYGGNLNASWGAEFAVGLFGAADFLFATTRGQVKLDMSSAEGIEDFMRDLADRAYSEWLEEVEAGSRDEAEPGF
ncbi:MAG: hypothetical protein ACU0BO_16295 [Limimaricola soesokkakensis]|uniref:hypothetical protein n=2 Tax=Limimaricola soesokkakensis TaxID=1343159 RepID=UPI00405958CD